MTAGVVICREELEEVFRKDIGEKYCFKCRKTRVFLYVVHAPVGLSYYGPTPHIECGTCGTYDGDLFPGGAREWGD